MCVGWKPVTGATPADNAVDIQIKLAQQHWWGWERWLPACILSQGWSIKKTLYQSIWREVWPKLNQDFDWRQLCHFELCYFNWDNQNWLEITIKWYLSSWKQQFSQAGTSLWAERWQQVVGVLTGDCMWGQLCHFKWTSIETINYKK